MAAQQQRLTASRIGRLKFDRNKPTKQILFDAQLAGFGVRVYASGRKAYVLQYGARNRRRLMVIAPCTTGHDVTKAREKAQDLLRNNQADGVDPLDEQKRVAASTVKAIVTEYIEVRAPHWAPREKKRCESRLKNHMGSLGEIRLDTLTRRDVREMHTRSSKKTKYEANRSLELLRAAINWAMSEMGWRASDLAEGENPATRIKRNRENHRREWIRQEELPALIKAINAESNTWMRSFFLMLLYTGARKGELLALQWSDVDLKGRTIQFRDTKNHEDHQIPLAPDAVKLLKSIPHTLGNPYVFCGQVAGKPINNPYKPWKRILKRTETDRHITIHDLRRTVGSLLATSGYSTQQIGKLLNHKSAITAKVYAEIADQTKAEMTDAMAEMLK